jgi:predicted nucleotidyltransferase
MNSDFKDLLRAFNDAGVRYLVVGGYAYAEHVEPRYTKDLDIWIERSRDNAERVLAGLNDFGAPLRELTTEDLTTAGTFFQIGLPPNRIDIISQLETMDFAECWERRKTVSIGELRVEYISLDDLIDNKERTARPHDLAERLRTARENLRKNNKK